MKDKETTTHNQTLGTLSEYPIVLPKTWGSKFFGITTLHPIPIEMILEKKYCKEIVLDLSKLGPSHHLKH